MNNSYNKCIKQLSNFKEKLIKEKNIKKGKLYFSWIDSKTEKVKIENDEKYLYNNLIKNTLNKYDINEYIYDKSNKEIQSIIKNNYCYDGKKYKLHNENISNKEIFLLLKHIVLKRGNVVWIDFGFNIGNEFGGMHPGIILKNFENELLVLPLSSKKPKEFKIIEEKYNKNEITIQECERLKEQVNEIVQLNKIFWFKNMIRFGNITRIRKISILRLNFFGSIGSISGKDLNCISEKIKNEF